MHVRVYVCMCVCVCVCVCACVCVYRGLGVVCVNSRLGQIMNMQIKICISNSQESREGSRGCHQIWTLPPIFQTLNHYTTEDLKSVYVCHKYLAPNCCTTNIV